MKKKEYRIIKQTLGNGNFRFKIEQQSIFDSDRWVHITDRKCIDTARLCIEALHAEEVIKEEVVE